MGRSGGLEFSELVKTWVGRLFVLGSGSLIAAAL
jgi:hypothetical protein